MLLSIKNAKLKIPEGKNTKETMQKGFIPSENKNTITNSFLKGFTLIELILVVAIVAILAGAMVPMILSARQEARISKAKHELDVMKIANKLCRSDTGDLCRGIKLLHDDPQAWGSPISGWNGPYIDEIHNDPWGTSYDTWIAAGVPNWWGYLSYGPNKRSDWPPPGDDIYIFLGTF